MALTVIKSVGCRVAFLTAVMKSLRHQQSRGYFDSQIEGTDPHFNSRKQNSPVSHVGDVLRSVFPFNLVQNANPWNVIKHI